VTSFEPRTLHQPGKLQLVQLIAKQKGLSNPVLDATVALVDTRLEANRKKQAA